jgi:thiol-disulfide isomerase/thioredoxin
VNLWATWCPPCVAEMPYFTQLHKEYAEKGVEVISVSADGKAAIANAVVPFQKKQQLPFAIQVLAEPNPDALTEVFGKELSGALPETFVYDKEGKLVKSWESEVTFEELEAAVKPLL